MNILERQLIWDTLRLHIPMIICATWVIVNQRKIIGDTLKRGYSGGLGNGDKERKDYLVMGFLGVITLIFTVFMGKIRQELTVRQRQEVVEKMLEEKVVTPQELQAVQEKEREREREQN